MFYIFISRIKCSEFVILFNSYALNKLSPDKVHKDMSFNGYEKHKIKGIQYYIGLIKKEYESLDFT